MRIHHRRPNCAALDDRRVARSIIAREVDARQCILARLAKRIPPIVIIRVVSLQLLQHQQRHLPDRGIPRRVHGRTTTQRPHEEVSDVVETTFREALKGLVAEEL